MSTATIIGSVGIAGLNFGITVSRSDEGSIAQTPTCPKAWAGVLTDNAGADAYVTTTETHDLEVGDFITIYWTAGIAYRVEITGKTGTTVVFDQGAISGDALPDAATAVIIAKEKTVTIGFDGDLMSMIVSNGRNNVRAHWQFLDIGDAVVLAQEIVASETWFWASGMNWGANPPITGNAVTYAYVSSADITADQIVDLGVLYDSVV